MSMLGSAMWALYVGSFKKSLTANLHSEKDADTVAGIAKRDYDAILAALPPFEKGDRFKVNIINCAMLTAFLKNVRPDHTLEEVTAFYHDAMDTWLTRYFCTHGSTYTKAGQNKLARDAAISQGFTNPYSWKFRFEPGPTLNQYTATFHTCGICRLMADHGLERYIPAMCVFDYDMAAMNNTAFSREFTLASGGPYCDCHYDHRG